jgi:hypothetical protein
MYAYILRNMTSLQEKRERLQRSKTAILIALSIIILMTLSGTAVAITGNYEPDSTPNVCMVALFDGNGELKTVSTGVLISPSVVLTAGHTTSSGEVAIVCFDQNPTSISPTYTGHPLTYPEYSRTVENAQVNGNHLFSVSDVGIILLTTSVQEITSATLPTANLADALPARSNLQVIGYGVQYQATPKNSGPINSWIGTFTRNNAQVQLLSNNFAGADKYLKCTANAAQDKGGVAFGDSGGPILINSQGESIVLAINAYVNSVNCNGLSYHTRIDNQQVLDWIGSFL